jgi:hypothetical protein
MNVETLGHASCLSTVTLRVMRTEPTLKQEKMEIYGSILRLKRFATGGPKE